VVVDLANGVATPLKAGAAAAGWIDESHLITAQADIRSLTGIVDLATGAENPIAIRGFVAGWIPGGL
jgi:hypothetical protein